MYARASRLVPRLVAASLLGARAAGADEPATVEPVGFAVSWRDTQFDAVNALDVEDLVRYAPDVFIRKRFAGDDGGTVSLRGTSTEQSARTLVMVDGFVVSNFLGNSSGFAPKWNVIGPSDVEQIDLLYGPYSARYGGNSMGGVVSVQTREPAAKNGYVTLQSIATPYEQYGVDDTFTGYSVEAGGSWKQASSPWSAKINARHLENVGQPAAFALLAPLDGPAIIPVTGAYTDPRLGSPVFGASSPVDVVQNQFNAGVGYEFRNGWKLESVFFGLLTRQNLTDSRTFLVDANGAPVYEANVGFDGASFDARGLTFTVDRRSEFLAGIRATGTMAGWRTTLNLSHYWIDTQDARTANFFFTFSQDGGGIVSLQDDAGWWNVGAAIERRFDRNRLAFGIDASQYDTRQDDFMTTNWRLASEPLFASSAYGSSRSSGAFVEDEIRLGEDSSVTLGVRADRWEAYDGGAAKDVNGTVAADAFPERRESSVDPKLGFETSFGERWHLALNLGTATRFPTVGELFQGRIEDVTRALDPDTFDPDLEPERSRDANLAVSRTFGKAKLTSSLFYQDVDDAIFSFPALDPLGSVVTRYRNIDRVRQAGVELIFDAADVWVEGLDVNLSVARLDARTVRNAANTATEDQRFPGIPDWRANGHVQYRMAHRVSASLGWRYASRPNSDLGGLSRGNAYGFQSEYMLVDARLTWKPNELLEASLGVDNLNDDEAYVVGPLAQRTGYAGIRLRF
jgi:iron complex outermembrane recepter protein